MSDVLRIDVVDSHTGGEPTRVVLRGGPTLVSPTMAQRRLEFSERFDAYRSAIVNEPRGSDVMVGALLTEPEHEGSDAGVIFFNNVGMLGMCGHPDLVAVAKGWHQRVGEDGGEFHPDEADPERCHRPEQHIRLAPRCHKPQAQAPVT